MVNKISDDIVDAVIDFVESIDSKLNVRVLGQLDHLRVSICNNYYIAILYINNHEYITTGRGSIIYYSSPSFFDDIESYVRMCCWLS